ncbi:MAG: glycine cleavage T C-terminal barrel domain-containing protein, partial [Acidimicrobiales bacterium]
AGVAPAAAGVGRFAVAPFSFEGVDCLAAGTGYTGEDGVECAVPSEAARPFWRAVLGAGVAPAGLGARDTLRLEAGLPLHGHELGPGINPLEARLGWVVGWDKANFRGKAALEAVRAAGGPGRLLCGLLSGERRPPRAGDRVVEVESEGDGALLGKVTSGNYSPVLEKGIALAFLPAATTPATAVAIESRGLKTPVQVVKPPFYDLVQVAK